MAITLGLVEAIDSNGVYVTMPGSKGVLRGPYKSLSTVAAGTTVLVASTDDGEQVVVGALPGQDGIHNVLEFGATGDGVSDDTAAVQSAMDAAAGVVLHIPRGMTFVVDTISVPSGTTISGGGTLKFKPNTTSYALLDVLDASDVVIDGVRFDGNVANQDVWDQYRHAINVTGQCQRIAVRGCTFENLIADGISVGVPYLGVGTPADIDIDGCTFLGDNSNRNGVAVCSATDVRIRGCHFEGMGRDDMPGAIDIEPNFDNEPVNGVAIVGNTFVGGGTPVLQKAIAVNNDVGADVTNVNIANNTIRGDYLWGIAVFGDDADESKTQVSVTGNMVAIPTGITDSAGIIAAALCRVTIADNTIDSATEAGIRAVGATFAITGNRVKNCTEYGIETLAETVDTGTIVGNLIEDCGTDASGAYGGMHINGSHILICGNKITSSSASKSQCGLYIESGVKNRVVDNTFLGMGVRAIISPVAPQAFGLNVYNGGFNSVGGTYPPASQSWVAGDVVYDLNPAAGGYIGWVCTTAGTPGTWKTFGAVSP